MLNRKMLRSSVQILQKGRTVWRPLAHSVAPAAALLPSLAAKAATTARSFSSDSTGSSSGKQTHFGFSTVDEREKEKLVGEVFRRVADR